MNPHFRNELDHLKERLLLMASRTEFAVRLACRALVERDDVRAAQVERNDREIDTFEMEVDELAVRLLSKAPLARDLRFITVAMKIATDLERIGDEATTMARRSLLLNRSAPVDKTDEIPRMTATALEMVNQALNAFIHGDADSARRVIPRDKVVDKYNQDFHDVLFDRMAIDPGRILPCHHLMVVSKCIERIADHAKNIAELVVYLNEGVDIRHHGGAPTEEDLRG